MTTLENFADKVRNDTQRASKLKRAIEWLDRCGDHQAVKEASVSVDTKFGSGVAGYTDAMTLINDSLLFELRATIAAVRQGAEDELNRIETRYAPLMSQGGDS